ncbi:hypothetical protein [Streptomyces fractus]|uniref:hypothetical protein n=1 Tax=Streptomyces fractus TaxID=641806 RepID=UPI003CEB5C14
MRYCIHCGVRVQEPERPLCPGCGAPHEGGAPEGPRPAAPTDTPEYVRVGSTRLPRWLPAALVAVIVVAGVAVGVSVANSPDDSQGSAPQAAPLTPATTTDTTEPDADTYDQATELPSYSSEPDDTEEPEETETEAAEDETVVTTYYDYINARDFRAAWDLGGSNLDSGSFDDWSAGFDTTDHISVEVADQGSGQVDARISASQTDGTVRTYAGTYTVQDGEIVAAKIQEVP